VAVEGLKGFESCMPLLVPISVYVECGGKDGGGQGNHKPAEEPGRNRKKGSE
jgi:hypothetical protein